MKIFQFSKIVLLSAILIGSLYAADSASNEDDKVENNCNVVYDACLAECDKSDNGSEECYKVCEEAYANCSDSGYEEEH